MSPALKFDTDAMIRLGKQLRPYDEHAESIGASMGTIPEGLPPHLGSVVPMECRRLEVGVRAIGNRVQATSAILVAVAERVRAADGTAKNNAISLAKFVLKNGLTITAGAAGKDAYKQLMKKWPDVWNSLDDAKAAKAADNLVRRLDPAGVKNIVKALNWDPSKGPMPAGLKSLRDTLRGVGKVGTALQKLGPTSTVLLQFLKDLNRSDIGLPTKLARALQAGLYDHLAGKASSTAVDAALKQLTKWTWTASKVGRWPLTLLAFGSKAVGATGLSYILGLKFLLPGANPNDKIRESLSEELRRDLKHAVWIVGRMPAGMPMPPPGNVSSLVGKVNRLDEKLAILEGERHSRKPIDPMDYREKAYETARILDERKQLTDRIRDALGLAHSDAPR